MTEPFKSFKPETTPYPINKLDQFRTQKRPGPVLDISFSILGFKVSFKIEK